MQRKTAPLKNGERLSGLTVESLLVYRTQIRAKYKKKTQQNYFGRVKAVLSFFKKDRAKYVDEISQVLSRMNAASVAIQEVHNARNGGLLFRLFRVRIVGRCGAERVNHLLVLQPSIVRVSLGAVQV
jgi:hypothetical protein